MVSLNSEPFSLVPHSKDWRNPLQPVTSTCSSATRAAQERSVVSRVEIAMLNKNVSIEEWLMAGAPQYFLSYHWTCQESAKHREGPVMSVDTAEHWSFTDLFTCV